MSVNQPVLPEINNTRKNQTNKRAKQTNKKPTTQQQITNKTKTNPTKTTTQAQWPDLSHHQALLKTEEDNQLTV